MNRLNSTRSASRDILVLDADRLRGAVVARALSRTFSNVRVYCEAQAKEAASILERRNVGLFLVTLNSFDADAITLLKVWSDYARAQTRVIVLSSDLSGAAVQAVRSLPIEHYFDYNTGTLDELETLCKRVLAQDGPALRPLREIERPSEDVPLRRSARMPDLDIRDPRSGPPDRRRTRL
jgi:DNA-binding NtrC family response regulator